MARDNKTTSAKIANIFLKYYNPLRNLNSTEIERLLQNARQGADEKLQLVYSEIEKSTPVFSICINKRIAGVANKKWDIIPIDDTPEAKKQAEQVKKMFDDADLYNKDGLTEAINHLVLATFRGRAAVKPFIENNKLIFKKLENWNFISYNGKNYWNPKADYTYFTNDTSLPNGVVELPDDEVCYITDDKPLDWVGLQIYLRQIIGEDNYARFIEKYGVPPVILKAPEGTPETELDKFNYRAQALFEGASGVLPSGTEVNYISDSRGQNPFIEFINHQTEIFCILATGGNLATIGGSSGLGSNVAEIQNDQFNSLVNADCKKIANSMTVAVKKCVEFLFNTNDIKCRFSYIEKEDVDVEKYLNMARMCKDMGISIDIEKLKEVTNLQFINEDIKDIWTPVKSE